MSAHTPGPWVLIRARYRRNKAPRFYDAEGRRYYSRVQYEARAALGVRGRKAFIASARRIPTPRGNASPSASARVR